MKAPFYPSIYRPRFPRTHQRYAQRISLPYFNRTILIALDDIVHLEGEGNYTFIYTHDLKRYLVSKTLKAFQLILDKSLFLRIHKSTIINLAYVYDQAFDADRSLNLVNGKRVSVSRRRLKEISLRINQFHQQLTN